MQKQKRKNLRLILCSGGTGLKLNELQMISSSSAD